MLVGTMDYIPPEVYKNYLLFIKKKKIEINEDINYSKAADFWATGCILYEFLTGVTCFGDET